MTTDTQQTSTKTKPKKIGQTVIAKYLHENGYEAIPPHIFYREMFPKGELAPYREDGSYDSEKWMYNAIILHWTNKFKTVVKHNDFLKEDCTYKQYSFKKHIVYDDLIAIDRAIEEANANGEQLYMSPISYLGRTRDAKHERFLYVLTIEIDDLLTEKVKGKRNLRQKGLETALHQWGANNNPRWENGWFIAPTAITCSGSGIHCHWFLTEPYPLFGGDIFDGEKKETYRRYQWRWFRQNFTEYVWNNAVSSTPIQDEPLGQSFRLVGSLSKDNKLVEAFWISKKRYSMEELFGLKIAGTPLNEIRGRIFPRECWDTTTKAQMDLTKPKEPKVPQKLIEAKEQWPDWYERRIVHKQKPRQRGHWHIKPDLYYWYRDLIQKNVHVGCRYYRIYTLAQYGAKCDIEFSQVEKDCHELGRLFQSLEDNKTFPLYNWEIEKAISAYFEPRAFETTIDYVNRKADLNIQKNKCNGNSRYDHLQADRLIDPVTQRPKINTCKANREISLEYNREHGLCVGGHGFGVGEKKGIVQQWRAEHPNGRKIDCERETGMSRHTVLKWWES